MKIQLWLTLGVTACLTFFPLAVQADVTFESMLKENGGDVDRNHWATEAIQNVVDKYHIMRGFPDKTFKGDQPLTRYEQGTGLYQVMKYLDKYIEDEVRKKRIPYWKLIRKLCDSVYVCWDEDTIPYSKLRAEYQHELNKRTTVHMQFIQKTDPLSRVQIHGTVEVRYRDRVSVSDNP